MKLDWSSVAALPQRLSPRERLLASMAAFITLGVVLYSLVWTPLVEGRSVLRRQIARKRQELVEIQRLRDRYLDLLVQWEAARRVLADPEPFSLFAHIESVVSKVIRRDKIESMNPDTKTIGNLYVEESVRLKLKAVTLRELVEMLYRIEKGDRPLRVTRLDIKKRFRDRYTFDVNATVSMLREAQSG